MARTKGGDMGQERRDSRVVLLDATASLLSERSTIEVSLSEIAKTSGLNSALIKYYFGGKEGLLLALLERVAERSMADLASLIGMDIPAEQKLRIHIGGIINTYYRSPYLNRLINYMIARGDTASSEKVAKIFVEPMVAAYRAMVAQGVAEGAFRPMDPECCITASSGPASTSSTPATRCPPRWACRNSPNRSASSMSSTCWTSSSMVFWRHRARSEPSARR